MHRKRIMRRKAGADIKGIGRYTWKMWGIAQRNEYLDGLESKINEIAENPNLGTARDDLYPGLRTCLYGEHVIFYLPLGTSVAIIRVLHQSMNINKWLDVNDIR